MIKLRAATYHDAEMILGWRNDADSIAACRRQRALTMDEIKAYVAGGFIATRDGVPMGLVRSEPLMELSWMVAPEFRRQGVGSAMLALMTEHSSSFGRVAFIRPGNFASQSIAAKAGFERVEGLEIWRRG